MNKPDYETLFPIDGYFDEEFDGESMGFTKNDVKYILEHKDDLRDEIINMQSQDYKAIVYAAADFIVRKHHNKLRKRIPFPAELKADMHLAQ